MLAESDVSVIGALLIFSFQFSLLFFHMGRPALAVLRRIGFNTQYRTLDVAENLGMYLSCTERKSQMKDFELILTGKWKLDIRRMSIW